MPQCLIDEGNYLPEDQFRSRSRATTIRDYAALELEHVWKKCWQFVCREEDIPGIGDRYVYDVGPLSFIIVRSGENSFRAFHNSCLHRGTRLCDAASGGADIQCPFHGWRWHLDGSLEGNPASVGLSRSAGRRTLPARDQDR